jgi:hypothetical protein
VAKSRSPLAPLKKGGTKVKYKFPLLNEGTKVRFKVPLLKGDLGGSSLRGKAEIAVLVLNAIFLRKLSESASYNKTNLVGDNINDGNYNSQPTCRRRFNRRTILSIVHR